MSINNNLYLTHFKTYQFILIGFFCLIRNDIIDENNNIITCTN